MAYTHSTEGEYTFAIAHGFLDLRHHTAPRLTPAYPDLLVVFSG